jgi:16S rRNA G966 N2-methylase RsmD
MTSSVYLGTNRSGSVLWEALSRGASRSSLIELLVSTFRIDYDRAAKAVDTFVDACRQRNFLAD